MKRRLGLTLPLVAVMIVWWSLVAASLTDLQYSGSTPPVLRASTFIVLGALVIAALMILAGFKDADARHASSDAPLERAVYRFAGLMVVLVLVFLAIFALVVFMSSFNTNAMNGAVSAPSIVDRLVGVYLPILLAAGAIVYVLLESMMKRKSAPVENAGVSETQKALAIGYSVPIIGTAFAVILGLIFYDAQGRKLEIWSWVVIQLVIAVALVIGTRFAARARLAKAVPKPAKVSGAAGAVVLNYVLSLVFAGAVSIMSFSYAQAAVDYLRTQQICVDTECSTTQMVTRSMDASWWLQQLLPAWALILLVEAVIYLVIVTRNSSEAKS